MKGLKLMGLTLAASTIAFSLSQVAHAEQMVKGENNETHYGVHMNEAEGGYTHKGNAGQNASYLADSDFVNALDSGQLNFNGYSIDQDNDDNVEYKKVYDQEVRATSDDTAVSIRFKVTDQSVTLDQMKDAYPSDKLNHIPHTSSNADQPDDGTYVYHGDQIKLQFKVEDGYVTSVTIGQGETE
ncbi:immunodominant staphylococcal antigen IsaB family protein [Staphylococcus caprae]|uniref:Immunodominant staphylococcal antigen B n=1 Tax=Staphylococcus caprae TaxID=29380 RepID=A0ABM7FP63_9STAP|nr:MULTISPECIES: hypothetical protein [Staphylococcus]EES42103.1 hypothetical protein HMPREF0793_0243 [Staphylococcus caprae M23864:W1]MBN6826903.1 hypothetical protein [Staphylococcus caprae]MBX5324111.1 hypothetical protein [Staphylococcus caprae]MDI0015326.1 hypothetical protein [Staphylococcus caprae]MEB8095687.1 hypothetical protein [Staphylococcus caprae]